MQENLRKLMDAKQINQTFDLVNYVSGLVKLHKSGAYWIGPCPICGGRDRFQIKDAVGHMWICRKCAPDKYHSAIDFFMAYHRLDFKQALERMGGDIQTPKAAQREPGKGKPITSPAPVQVAPDPIWQADAWKQIDAASDRLLEEPEGEPGRRYLMGRSISIGAMYMNLLGYATVYRRPAIVIPYLDIGNVVTAVKYRFIDELVLSDNKKRFAMMNGSLPYLFGVQHILESDQTLLFVEGEMNAISVLQTLPRGVSVVSAGSEGNGNAALLRTLARHYSRVVIWTDQPDKARTIRERMHRPEALLLQSFEKDGVKYDANQMLQIGYLADFISHELSTECLGVPVDTELTAYMGATI